MIHILLLWNTTSIAPGGINQLDHIESCNASKNKNLCAKQSFSSFKI